MSHIQTYVCPVGMANDGVAISATV